MGIGQEEDLHSIMRYLIYSVLIVLLSGCMDDRTLFTKLDAGRTGIGFVNAIRENEDANVLNYAYFYNGGGVAVGDINNDGLQDLLFTGNMSPNRLYLNKGDFRFEDVTEQTGIASKQGWCTGATMADINGDGLTDIYICRSGDIDPFRRRNLLFINEGNLHFHEAADSFGLADEGYSTQAAFFDYDRDGDLDMVLINHSLQQYANGAFENAALREKKDPAFATKLYRNDDGHFRDVSQAAGVVSNVLSFGLGIAVSDLNGDGWPDFYVSNDFNEPDHLYINNRDGSFTDRLRDCMDQTSLYSMGSDCADINNDGLPDLLTLDMLAEDNHTQKMHSGAENFDKFQLLWQQGFYYQYSRNMLQLNNGDGSFSEIGQAAGISNTDWSWSALLCDWDNDGNKDLFISNGYAKDFTDMDFIRYHFSHGQTGPGGAGVLDLLGRMPSLNPPDYVFRNNGDKSFTKMGAEWGLGERGISSGAAYVDLDNDGAMDLVVSRVDEPAAVYRNNALTFSSGNHYLRVRLTGSPGNTLGIGARLRVYCGGQQYFTEQALSRGFQSSVDPVLHVGLGKSDRIDSVLVVWPDTRRRMLRSVKADQEIRLSWKESDSLSPPFGGWQDKPFFKGADAPAFVHRENPFNDFASQSLLPHYCSRPGPPMAMGDVNGDGRTDLFVGGAAGQAGAVFVQDAAGGFRLMPESALLADSAYEASSAVFSDLDGDGDVDLYVASGGYEFQAGGELLSDRLYLNDGAGHFTRAPLPDLRFPKSCVRVSDIDHDGHPDLFIGGRVAPGRYPLSPGSRILMNDGHGGFREATAVVAAALDSMGMVTDAVWTDLDGDGWDDLAVVGEWMPVRIFHNDRGRLREVSGDWVKFPSEGWWNRVVAADMDGDGDPDLVLGNMGNNTQFRASVGEPVSLYYKDFDGNGIIDPILCYYIGGVSYPAVSRDDLVAQLPGLKKKFLSYSAYADATIKDIFDPAVIRDAGMLKAVCMSSLYLENKGREGFVRHDLPVEAQAAPVYAIGMGDADGDGRKDLVLAGDDAWTRIRFGRERAGHGVLLRGNGSGGFEYVPQWRSGLQLREDVRSVEVIHAGGFDRWIFGCNDAGLREYDVRK